MWVAGGVAMVLTAVVLVVAALLEGDRRTVRPRRTGTVTAEELRAANLPVAWRGYDRGHVDAILARAATTLEQVQRYGTLEEPVTPGADSPGDRPAGRPPSFLAGAVNHPDRAQDAPEAPVTGDEPPDTSDAPAVDETPEEPGSGEELEDGRGDDPGGLDR